MTGQQPDMPDDRPDEHPADLPDSPADLPGDEPDQSFAAAGDDDPFAALGALFGGGGGMEGLLAQAQQMQADIADTQQRLAGTQVSGTSGGGLVRATVTGDRELVALTIDPAAIDPEDPETLADLVVAAVRAANDHARTVAEQAMAGAVPELPDLSGLGLPGATGVPGGFGPSLPGAAAAASVPPIVPSDDDPLGGDSAGDGGLGDDDSVDGSGGAATGGRGSGASGTDV